MNLIGNIVRRCFNREKLNILTCACHESYETNLCQTGHNFYSLSFLPEDNPYKIKHWDSRYRPVPLNYTVLDAHKRDKQIPPDVDFDLILSHHKFGQYQTLKPIADKYQLPLVQLEHTICYDGWSEQYLLNLKNMKGDCNVFISENSRDKWLWSQQEAEVIRHGIDTDKFCPVQVQKAPHILSVVNDFINRTVPCGFDTWREVTEGLPVRVLGATPGLSKPASSVEELIHEYQGAAVFLNTSRFSPVPMALMEAMACGCACVTTGHCMVPEIIEHGKNGLMSNEPKELRQFCQELLKDEKLRGELGQNARQTIAERFSLKGFVENWNNLFRKVIVSY